MSETVQAAKEQLTELSLIFRARGHVSPTRDQERADAIDALLADHTRLEGENERLRNELDDALHDYGNAESEAKAAEADNEDLKAALTESRREVSELREGLKSCRDQFLMYANSHAAKGTSEGDAKAVTNREFAEMCAALVNGEGE